MCDSHNHNLIEVFRTSYNDIIPDSVVRWCKDCGSIVVDGEIDNRILPGYYVKMKFIAV